jgi:hypothetical protein
VGGFVESYMIWMYHGEKVLPPTQNPLNKIIEDIEFDRLFDAYDDFDTTTKHACRDTIFSF